MKVVKLVFLKKPDAAPTKRIRSHKAIDLTLVMSKWYASCELLRIEKEKEPRKLRSLHVGGVNGKKCQHLQILTTNFLQHHLEMARRKESSDETWYSGKTDDVPGELEHKNCLR